MIKQEKKAWNMQPLDQFSHSTTSKLLKLWTDPITLLPFFHHLSKQDAVIFLLLLCVLVCAHVGAEGSYRNKYLIKIIDIKIPRVIDISKHKPQESTPTSILLVIFLIFCKLKAINTTKQQQLNFILTENIHSLGQGDGAETNLRLGHLGKQHPRDLHPCFQLSDWKPLREEKKTPKKKESITEKIIENHQSQLLSYKIQF